MQSKKIFVDIDALNRDFAKLNPQYALARLINDGALGRLALVSSFGAESVVLLHMIAQIDRDFPVVFLDTQMLFAETIAYQLDVAKALGLTNIQRRTPDADAIAIYDSAGQLNRTDPSTCCRLRKGAPLAEALTNFDGWITGRKRFQGSTREALAFAERDPNNNKIKLNPLWNWTAEELRNYMSDNNLPRHPLSSEGYASIGCEPCTTPVKEGEDIRAGRWRGQEKTECGIHLAGVAPTDFRVSFDGSEVTNLPSTELDPNADYDVDTLHNAEHVTVLFSNSADGRGFGIARALRRAGYTGRLRAKGELIPDQYVMAQRVGFDEIEIPDKTAIRHGAAKWFANPPRNTDYQSRVGQTRR